MDIFQQLMEYENQKNKKHLWEGEKVLLIWSGSEHHQHLGSAIDINHLPGAFDYCIKENFTTEAEKKRLVGSSRHILEGLLTHEFGNLYDNSNPKNPAIKINRDGILAGQILFETKNLKNPKLYNKWIWDWWVIYWATGLLIIMQLLKLSVEFYKEFRQSALS